MRRRFTALCGVAAMVGLAVLVGCGKSASVLRCGPGTSQKGGACVPADDGCGSGTADVSGRCQPVSPPLVCGPGTHEEGGVCLRDPAKDPMLEPTIWSANVRVSTSNRVAVSPSIAVDSKGRVYVAFQTGDAVELWASNSSTAAFSMLYASGPAVAPPMSDALPDVAIGPAVAVDASDRIALVFSSVGLSGPGGLWSATSADGVHFERVLLTSSSSFFSSAVTLGVTPKGNVAALWADAVGLTWAETSTSTGRFLPPVLVDRFRNDGTVYAFDTAGRPAFDKSGRPLVPLFAYAFAGGSGASSQRFQVVPAVPRGTPELDEMLAITAHFSFDAQGTLVSDARGRFRTLFSNARSRRVQIYESRSEDGITWTPPAPAFTDPREPTANGPSLAVDEEGGLHAVFSDTRTGGWLVYAADAPPGGDFGPPMRVSEVEGLDSLGGILTSLTTAIAVRADRIYAAWADPRSGIYFSTAPVAR